MIDVHGFQLKENVDEELEGLVNTDGLPVAKSSGSQVWPIQIRFLNDWTSTWLPIIVGVYQGYHKPKIMNEYLNDFVTEAHQLLQTGLIYQNGILKIPIFGYSCDAPANAMMKQIKIHTGYESCPKCEVYGKWAGRVVLLETTAPLRTHACFINQKQEGHHIGRSVLEQLGTDMIKSFAIDYMHCVLLGVMRKLLWLWIKGPLSTRIGRLNIERISVALGGLVDFIPDDFARKPRSLEELARWKATELRQFLLYTGPVVLKEIFKEGSLKCFYDHFLILVTAIKILSSPHLCQVAAYNQYAKDLLIYFVEKCKILYGEWFISYNVHCLIHLADDVIRFGPLDRYSSFPFENNMKTVKAMIRKHECILPQIVRRIEQDTNYIHSHKVGRGKTALNMKHTNGPVLNADNGRQYRVLHYKSMLLKCDAANSCVILNDETVVKISNFIEHNNSISIIGQEFNNRLKMGLFSKPLKSSKLGIYSVQLSSISCNKSWPLTAIKFKAACIPHSTKNNYAIFPLMHTEN